MFKVKYLWKCSYFELILAHSLALTYTRTQWKLILFVLPHSWDCRHFNTPVGSQITLIFFVYCEFLLSLFYVLLRSFPYPHSILSLINTIVPRNLRCECETKLKRKIMFEHRATVEMFRTIRPNSLFIHSAFTNITRQQLWVRVCEWARVLYFACMRINYSYIYAVPALPFTQINKKKGK